MSCFLSVYICVCIISTSYWKFYRVLCIIIFLWFWVLRENMISLKGALSSLRSFLATESPFKMMKNVFYFTSKALLVLEIFNFFVLTFLVGQQIRLIRRTRLISKIYDVTAWVTNNWIHILPNILRSKGNQTRKLGQLIDYNTRIIFIEK